MGKRSSYVNVDERESLPLNIKKPLESIKELIVNRELLRVKAGLFFKMGTVNFDTK